MSQPYTTSSARTRDTHTSFGLCVMLGTFLWLGCSDQKVLAVVGGTKITRADLQARLDAQSPAARTPAVDELQSLVGRELLAEGARRADLDEDPAVRARLAASEREILAQAYLDKKLATAVSEENARRLYESKKAELSRREISVQHIIVRVPANATDAQAHDAQLKAQQAHARVVAGEDFDTVAAELSDDADAKTQHGRLPKVMEGQVDPTFFAAAVALKKGETSSPVRSSSGFHVIRALEEPQTVTPSFESVRGRLTAELRQKSEETLLQKLRNDVGVKVYVDRLSGEQK